MLQKSSTQPAEVASGIADCHSLSVLLKCLMYLIHPCCTDTAALQYLNAMLAECLLAGTQDVLILQ